MKTEKIEKERWKQILKEACYIKSISIPKIIEQLDIPQDKAELVLQSVKFSRNRKRKKQNYIRAMNSLKAQRLISDLRLSGTKWKVIAEIVGLSEKHCMKLHAKTKNAERIIKEKELSFYQEYILDLLLTGGDNRNYNSKSLNIKKRKLVPEEIEYLREQLLNNPAINKNGFYNFLLLPFGASAPIKQNSISNFTNDTFLIQFDCPENYTTEKKSAWDTYRIAKSYGFVGTPKEFFNELNKNENILLRHQTKMANIEIKKAMENK